MQLPKFSLPASDGKTYSESDFKKGIFVFYLYPKDMTPGCTIESQNFRNLNNEFESIAVRVFGISKDSLKSHDKFCQKESLNFPLISDEECVLIAGLGSWTEKSMFGKKYMGIDRSTFVIQDGKVVQEWRNVKVLGHAKEVLEFCKNLV